MPVLSILLSSLMIFHHPHRLADSHSLLIVTSTSRHSALYTFPPHPLDSSRGKGSPPSKLGMNKDQLAHGPMLFYRDVGKYECILSPISYSFLHFRISRFFYSFSCPILRFSVAFSLFSRICLYFTSSIHFYAILPVRFLYYRLSFLERCI